MSAAGAVHVGGAPPARRATGAAQAAFVLHSHDWSETSLIVELFTREHGRVVAAAKGAKRPTSHLRAVLMPFQRIQVQFARGRGDDAAEVRTLRSAEWAGGEVTMRGAAWFAGFYVNELLLRLLARDDPHPLLFDVYALTLRQLGDDETASEAALRAFELLLLREGGVLPELDRTTLTQVPLQDACRYVLHAEQGLVEAGAPDGGLGGAAWRALYAALARTGGDVADAWTALLTACAGELPALKAQLRGQLHYHLAGARLRTREVMVDAQRLLEADRHEPTGMNRPT
ncbi:MAG: DNA repair protein RecO [Nitrospira sp.]|nr:DNA repair protein RecO [Nitrospira sp.]